MTSKYEKLETYLRNLPVSQEIATLSFEFIEELLKAPLPHAARHDSAWWSNQRPGFTVETVPWMDAGWLTDTVDLHANSVRFVRQ